MRYRNFIKSDIELIKENANFNDEQKQVFEMLISPAVYGKIEMQKKGSKSA